MFTLLTCAIVIRAEYYSIDGQNNNIDNPLWGSTNRAYQRIYNEWNYLSYVDSSGTMDSSLPNPRKISNVLGTLPKQQSINEKFDPLSGIAWYLNILYLYLPSYDRNTLIKYMYTII